MVPEEAELAPVASPERVVTILQAMNDRGVK
jgi:hypothetical protein